MPVMDGLAATRRIRRAESIRGSGPVPIIALTANARPEDVQASHEAGCTAHLAKPISKQKLQAALEQHGPDLREAHSSRPNAIFVRVPEGLESIVPGYLESRIEEVPVLLRLLESSDYEEIRTLSHNMKGTGSAYGFPELTRLGAEMESAAKISDRETLSARFAELRSYVDQVRLVS
jgi:response regulator RpfG family c-di-GMP phosphodiesterase